LQEIGRATAVLDAALGFSNWHPPEPLTYTRSASEVLSLGRMDAQHFQPKYAALISKMREHGEVIRLGDVLAFCDRGRQPNYSEIGLPVVNSRHVRVGEVVVGEENRLALEEAGQLGLPEEKRLTIRNGDVLMNGTGVGTLGRCAPYLHEGKALPDNHVTILRMNADAHLDPVFLAVQLNSIVGQMQVEQHFKGSSGQIELYPSEIREFRIWRASNDVQAEIRACIEYAHTARREAKALLDRAKRAVEIAIEESEAAALAFLQSL